MFNRVLNGDWIPVALCIVMVVGPFFF